MVDERKNECITIKGHKVACGKGILTPSFDCLFPGFFFFQFKRSFFDVGFLGNSDSRESACNAGDPGSIPESGRSPGDGSGNPLQHSCLENSMDRPRKCRELDTTEH